MSVIMDMLGGMIKDIIPQSVIDMLTEENVKKFVNNVNDRIVSIEQDVKEIRLNQDKILVLMEGSINERNNHNG